MYTNRIASTCFLQKKKKTTTTTTTTNKQNNVQKKEKKRQVPSILDNLSHIALYKLDYLLKHMMQKNKNKTFK